MKRLLFLVLASFLVLAACGQKENSKSENKKAETPKKDTKDKKEKDNKKKEDKKKVDKKETTDNQQQENPDQQVDNSEQPAVQPGNTQQVEAPQQTNEQQPVQPQAPVQQGQNVQPTQQAPVNSARQQALNEGIDFDNPTPAQIERMRELSKQSPYGMQEPTQAGPME